MSTNGTTAWIAADWGTSNLRLWALDKYNTVIAQRRSDKGMNALSKDQFEPALLELAGDLLPSETPTPVVICGMAGARQGWLEAPYCQTPCPPPGLDVATRVPTQDPRLAVHILPGVNQPAPADVMRGEETQIAGFIADRPDYCGFLCLPGTHSKWARLQAGTITGFRTFMTGEIFALLASQSVLRHSVVTSDRAPDAFADGVRAAVADPAGLAAHAFGIRAASLLDGLGPSAARARLSGLLIGMEIAAMLPSLPERPVPILGGGEIAQAYVTALTILGRQAEQLDAEDVTLRGLTLAYQILRETHQ